MASNRYAKLAVEIATSFELWGEYVDPYGTMSKGEFDAMGIDERMALMAECHPDDMAEAFPYGYVMSSSDGRIGPA